MAKRLNDAAEVIIAMILGLMVFVAGAAEEPCGRTACGGRAGDPSDRSQQAVSGTAAIPFAGER